MYGGCQFLCPWVSLGAVSVVRESSPGLLSALACMNHSNYTFFALQVVVSLPFCAFALCEWSCCVVPSYRAEAVAATSLKSQTSPELPAIPAGKLRAHFPHPRVWELRGCDADSLAVTTEM